MIVSGFAGSGVAVAEELAANQKDRTSPATAGRTGGGGGGRATGAALAVALAAAACSLGSIHPVIVSSKE